MVSVIESRSISESYTEKIDMRKSMLQNRISGDNFELPTIFSVQNVNFHERKLMSGYAQSTCNHRNTTNKCITNERRIPERIYTLKRNDCTHREKNLNFNENL